MFANPVNQIAGATFRSSRRFRLVPRERAPRHVRAAVAGLADDVDFFGLLLPRSSVDRETKAVCHDTARLFEALRMPGELPPDLVERLGGRADKAIARLVLDGILELQIRQRFVSGPEAFGHLFTDIPHFALRGAIGQLTFQALVSAQHFLGAGFRALASYLYRYNTAPASPAWRSKLPTTRAAHEHLATTLVPWRPAAVHRTWTLLGGRESDSHWIMWRRSRVSAGPAEFRRLTACKLFISPTCGALRETFHSTIPILADSPAFAFKVGSDLPGWLRPDKLVAYFARHADLTDTAARLQAALNGVPWQGVPFSAALSGDGLLSWGMDPAEDAQTFGWNGRESWRVWVTHRLAESLLAASRCPDLPVAPWTFALAALELDGIVPTTFVPAEGIWAGTAGI
jgi:hypothetical protein